MKNLAGRTAVVTGGGSGIGRGTVLALADAGMNVVIPDIDEAAAARVGDEVAGRGTRALVVPTDVTDKSSIEALADAAVLSRLLLGAHGLALRRRRDEPRVGRGHRRVLVEKTLPFGRLGGRVAGIGLAALGLAGLTGVL
jgi:NAD(P)-dependent dehydrogenase (short-subunit alcohol dehydrogenase family)